MKHYFEISCGMHCPIRGFLISADDDFLHAIEFVLQTDDEPVVENCPNPLAKETKRQIAAYFTRKLQQFDLPLKPQGTDFQKRVWAKIADIPFGELATYGKIAESVGGANRARAVGQAANRNPIPLVIPCHRVVGSTGAMTGFAPGIAAKVFLIAHEKGVNVRQPSLF